MKFKLLFVVLSFGVFISTAWAQDTLARRKQILRDLCTLNLYMSGQHNSARTSSVVVDELLDPENNLYPDTPAHNSQPRSSYLARVEALGEIYSASFQLEEFSAIFGELASNHGTTYVSMDLCTLDQIVTPSWMQFNMRNPSFNEIIPALKQEFGIIRGRTNDDVSGKAEKVLARYLTLASARNKRVLHEFSIRGSDLMDSYFDHGISFYPYTGVPFDPDLGAVDGRALLQRIRRLGIKRKNPLYWDGDYFTGITFPTTTKIWRLYASPLAEFATIYDQALARIENGTFQAWWREFVVR